MKLKNSSVECNFHPRLTAFLFVCDYHFLEKWEYDILLTSGSEQSTMHSYTSLHYADPCCAADVRSWDIPYKGTRITAEEQKELLVHLGVRFCFQEGIPIDWMEVILESNHFHIEYQPKRPQ